MANIEFQGTTAIIRGTDAIDITFRVEERLAMRASSEERQVILPSDKPIRNRTLLYLAWPHSPRRRDPRTHQWRETNPDAEGRQRHLREVLRVTPNRAPKPRARLIIPSRDEVRPPPNRRPPTPVSSRHFSIEVLRAWNLLREFLTDKQKRTLEQWGWFDIRSGNSEWRIYTSTDYNVVPKDRYGVNPEISLCAVPTPDRNGRVPIYDAMLAQMLVLENNPKHYLKKAHSTAGNQTWLVLPRDLAGLKPRYASYIRRRQVTLWGGPEPREVTVPDYRHIESYLF